MSKPILHIRATVKEFYDNKAVIDIQDMLKDQTDSEYHVIMTQLLGDFNIELETFNVMDSTELNIKELQAILLKKIND